MAESTEWTRERIKQVLDVLKEMKDFEKVPLPMNIHKEFDIPLNKPKNSTVMDYFERYMEISKLPVDSTEVIDGRIAHKDVVFPTSILEPCKIPYPELQLDNGEEPRVIMNQPDDDDQRRVEVEIPTNCATRLDSA